MPTTSIYSLSDGVVAWQASLNVVSPMSENIEVQASHTGLGVNPLALLALADRLAQAEGQWRAFERKGLRRFVYRDPHRHHGKTEKANAEWSANAAAKP